MLKQIVASAGAGKTYQLTGEFLTLLKAATTDNEGRACGAHSGSGISHCWSEILAVTFTNKAATEMKERVVGSLKRRALGEEHGHPASDWQQREAARWVAILLRRYSSLNIRTIDSLLNMLVRLSALDLNLPPDFETVFETADLFDPIYDHWLQDAMRDSTQRKHLARACHALLMHTNMEGFIPGDRLRERILKLISLRHKGIEFTAVPEEVLNGRLVNLHTDLTNNACEVASRIAEEGIKANANLLKYLAKLSETTPYTAKFPTSKMAEKPDFEECVNKASKGKSSDELHSAYLRFTAAYESFIRESGLIRRALEFAPFVEIAEPLERKLNELQQIQGKVLNALCAGYARQILEGEYGASEAFCRMGNALTHLLIDEFQDTSDDQWRAIQPLAAECLSKGGSFTYVGDVKQAIYGWRGGDAELFDGILSDEELRAIAPDPKSQSLPNNWRSAETVVRFNNEIFSRLEERGVAKAVAAAMLPDETPTIIQDRMALDVTEGFRNAAQQLPDFKQDGKGLVKLYSVYGEKKENLNAAVREQLHTLLTTDLMQRRAPSEIAVLVRTNGEAADVASWLLEWNIPVITENSLRLAAHPVVTQAVSFLSFLDYPLADISFWEFISGNELFGSVSGISSAEMTDWLAEVTTRQRETGRSRRLFSEFRDRWPELWNTWIRPFYSQAGLMSCYDVISELFNRYGILNRYPADRLFLRRFLEVVHAAEANGLRSLSAFLDFWKESGGEEKVPLPENVDAVRIMTMHKSKGLEFPVVIIPFHRQDVRADNDPEPAELLNNTVILPRCKELGLPYYEAMAKTAREQLHLLYVAWTRPREELHSFITTTDRATSLMKALEILLDGQGLAINSNSSGDDDIAMADGEAIVTIGTPPPPSVFVKAGRYAEATCRGRLPATLSDDSRTVSPDMLPDMPSGLLSDMPSGGVSGIPSGLISGATSGEASGRASGIISDKTIDLQESRNIDETHEMASGTSHTTDNAHTDEASHADSVSKKWTPMGWLPRLKIFRNPLQETAFSERHRGTLAHACVERLRLTGNTHLDAGRAVRHAIAASPIQVPDKEAITTELTDMLEWLAGLPEFHRWQQYGTPEQAIMDEHGQQHIIDLLVIEPGSATSDATPHTGTGNYPKGGSPSASADSQQQADTGITIIEYKTGQPTEIKTRAHRQQVRRYANLLKAMPDFATANCRAVIVYLDAQELLHVDLSDNAPDSSGSNAGSNSTEQLSLFDLASSDTDTTNANQGTLATPANAKNTGESDA